MQFLKRCQLSLFLLLLAASPCLAENATLPGQTVQVYSELEHIYGKPTWTIILRNPETQQVFPYLLDFGWQTSFEISLPIAQTLVITASRLQWSEFAEINNFCGLENKTFSGQILFISLKGILSPVPLKQLRCNVSQF